VIKKEPAVLKFILGFLSVALTACASGPKADIPNTANPQTEISKLGVDLQGAVDKNVDVLAPKYFKASQKAFDEAKHDLSKGKKQEEILDDVRVGRGALDKAYSESQGHEAIAPTLFAARQAALKAGASTHPELQKDLENLDADTMSVSEDLAKASADKMIMLQDRYVAIEKRTVVLNELGKAQGIVSGAKNDGAKKRAPQTLKKAELSLKNAESTIQSNVRNPQGYQAAVTMANEDATLLLDVMNTSKQSGKGLPEATALKIVGQNRQIGKLKTDLSTTTAQGAAAQAAFASKSASMTNDLQDKENVIANQNETLNSQGQQLGASAAALVATGEQLNASDEKVATQKAELESKDKALGSANSKVEIQRAIEKARSEFSPSQAEAYQQGDRLLIRLKNVGFASGRSDLPAASLAMLAQVSDVAKSLNASDIKVEGHTDSVGTETQNKTISDERAGAVATYFKSNGFAKINVESEGYGFSKPIATNKSKAGRAQNRRVDIIITPGNSDHSLQ
jgi:outer membrane protein OmpA-like peptidoglycan-associated protein